MAVTTGETTQSDVEQKPMTSLLSSSKRKRSPTPITNGHQPANGETRSDMRPAKREAVHDSITDIWTVLKSHDLVPSLLDNIKIGGSQEDVNGQPPAKKPRTSGSGDAIRSLSDKVAEQGYSSYDALASDFLPGLDRAISALPHASEDIVSWQAQLNQKGYSDVPSFGSALKILLQDLVTKELRDVEYREANGLSNGVKSEPSGDTNGLEHSRTVLTLFGNAQGQKQLFSSLQTGGNNEHSEGFGGLGETRSVPIFRENGLPVGITSTRVLETPTAAMAKRASTFFDLFAPPANLPPLLPPRSSKIAQKSSTINWSHSPADGQSRRIGFVHETLATGCWLGYGGIPPVQEPSSPSAKRRQRDRTLSMSANDAVLSSKPAEDGFSRDKEKALFHGAYSSFAPSRDDGAVLVPGKTKTNVWWQRYGSEFFDELSSASRHTENERTDLDSDEDASFKEAVDAYVPVVWDDFDNRDNVGKSGADLLEDVSQMIGTLYSYQRIRLMGSNESLQSEYRWTSGARLGPSTPTSAERDAYNMLKSQLTMIIDTLPPYLVAKLDGDQLEELNIRHSFTVKGPDVRGVMEEDQGSRIAKQQAFNAAVGGPPQQRSATQVNRNLQSAAPRSTGQPIPTPAVRPGASYTRQPLSGWENPPPAGPRPGYGNLPTPNQQRVNTPVSRPTYPLAMPPRNPSQNGVSVGQTRPGQSPYSGSPQVTQSPRNVTQVSQAQYTQPLSQQQMYGQGQAQRTQLHQPITSPSPQSGPSVGLSNGVSRPQTPGTPSTTTQQQPSTALTSAAPSLAHQSLAHQSLAPQQAVKLVTSPSGPLAPAPAPVDSISKEVSVTRNGEATPGNAA